MSNACLIIVLYQQSLTDSQTFQTLQMQPELKEHHLLIYDNSPLQATEEAILNQLRLTYNITYIHNPKNGYTYQAYQTGLTLAKQACIPWLILLDQDTAVSNTYLNHLKQIIPTLSPNTVALVPKVFTPEGNLISPSHPNYTSYLTKKASLPKPGLLQGDYTAIASGAVIQTQFLLTLGGFSKAFPLDYLDHWLFWQIQQHHKSIYLLPDNFTHHLSITKMQSVSKERYQAILNAEHRFYQQYLPDKLHIYQKKLWLRYWKQKIKYPNHIFSLLTKQKLKDIKKPN